MLVKLSSLVEESHAITTELETQNDRQLIERPAAPFVGIPTSLGTDNVK
jgi:hypothetical protein